MDQAIEDIKIDPTKLAKAKTVVNPLDEALEHIAQAVEEWKATNTPEVLKRRVKALLDANSEKITLKLLGFKVDYKGAWDLDHYNGSSGNSSAGEYLQKHQSEAIQEWLKHLSLPKLSAKAHNEISKKLQSEYHSQLLSNTWTVARDAADRDAKHLVEMVASSNHIDNYLKLVAIINSPEKNEK